MPDYSVSVNITATDLASAAINTVKSSLSSLSTTASSASTAGLNTLNQSAGNLAGGMVAMSTGVNSAISSIQGLMGSQIVQGAIEMVNLGLNVRSTTAAFEALAGEDAAGTLNEMREATSGVASDFALMNAANRFFQLGIAQTGEEAAELTDIAITLGRVMGSDASTSIEAFGALLANQSIPRLDNFGISSARVRERVIELKDAGYDAQEAFTMAVMEQGRISLERLGSAADVGASNVARLTVRWENFFNTIAEGAANVVNDAAGTIEMLAQMDAALDEGGGSEVLANPIGTFIQVAGGAVNQAMGWGDNEDATTGESPLLSMYGAQPGVDVLGAGEFISEQNAANAAMVAQAIREAKDNYHTMMVDAGTWGDRVMVGADSIRDFSTTLDDVETTVISISTLQGQIAQGWDAYTASWAAVSGAMSVYDIDAFASNTEVGGSSFARGEIGGQSLFTDAEATAALNMSTYYNNLLTDAQALHATGLITAEELANVQSTADAAAALADNAQRGAEAFNNMTLSQAFGQTGGGMGGEMSDDVLAYMQGQGLSDSALAAYQQSLQLGTGQQTSSSINYDAVIVPMIADIISQYGVEAGAQAMANVQSGMATSTLMGMNDGQMAGNMASFTGYTYAHNAEEDQMMAEGQIMGGGTLEEAAGFDIEAYMEQVASVDTSMTNIATSGSTFEGSMAASVTSMETIKTTVDAISSRLNTVRTLRVNVQINTPAIRGQLSELIREIVGDNGGVVPGTDDHPGAGGT